MTSKTNLYYLYINSPHYHQVKHNHGHNLTLVGMDIGNPPPHGQYLMKHINWKTPIKNIFPLPKTCPNVWRRLYLSNTKSFLIAIVVCLVKNPLKIPIEAWSSSFLVSTITIPISAEHILDLLSISEIIKLPTLCYSHIIHVDIRVWLL